MLRFALLLPYLFLPALLAAQESPIKLERVARIGCLECDGPEQFAGIQTLTVAGGRIFVADREAPFIRVFDLRGRNVRAFGRDGDGPGELRLPIHIGWRVGSASEVYDMRQRRFTRFDSLGAVVRTRTVPGFVVAVASLDQPSESYILTSDFRSQDQPVGLLGDTSKAPMSLVTLHADFPLHSPGELPRTAALAARPGGGLAVGDGISEYRIRLYDRLGKQVGEIVRDLPRRKKTPAELDQEREQVQKMIARTAAMRRAEGGSGAPTAFKPREEWNHFNLDALQYDERGRLWVRTQRGGLSATIFDIFDAAGRYQGEVRVAERLGVFALGDGHLAARTLDADEVEFVGVWRVR